MDSDAATAEEMADRWLAVGIVLPANSAGPQRIARTLLECESAMAEPTLNVDKQAVDTLGLRPQDMRVLVDELNRKSQLQHVEVERRRTRYPFNTGEVSVQVRHPNGAETTYRMLTRNLNSHGIGFILGRFVYLNTVCAIELPTLDHERITVTGKVVHCRHLSGVVHELGVAFDRPIEVENFIASLQQARDEAAAKPQLTGRVLIVAEFASERRLLAHLLDDLGLASVEAGNDTDMLSKLSADKFDLLVIDTDSTEDDGMSLLGAARKAGFNRPILALSINSSESARADAQMCGFAGLISKPLDATQLLLHLSKSMPQIQGPIASTFANDPAMKPIVQLYVNEAITHSSTLSLAMESATLTTVTRLLKHLKGTGSSYGFDIVTRLAATALEQMGPTAEQLKLAHASVNDLIGVLARLSAEPA